MRLIPVIDLLNGLAVHAVKGDRHHYHPVKSALCGSSDPLAMAKAFRDHLGLTEIYVADLNAIQGSSYAGHRDIIASLACRESFEIMLDAGISNEDDALEWLGHGIRKVIIGSETLRHLSAHRTLVDSIGPERLVFSLDVRNGNTLSQCPDLAALSPVDVLGLLANAGWQEVLLLDLAKVGSEEGMDRALVAETRIGFPDLNLLVGGGLANVEQLIQMKGLGVAGVLVATALHRGMITARHISEL